MKLSTSSRHGNLSVKILTEKKLALLTIEENENSFTYELTDDEAEKLGTALLKCHAKFTGFKSFVVLYDKETKK